MLGVPRGEVNERGNSKSCVLLYLVAKTILFDVAEHENATSAERERAGLCVVCRYTRRIKSDRGSTFYFCARSLTDASFPKYPRLPVIECVGYEPEVVNDASDC
jgi:hypothetical protein